MEILHALPNNLSYGRLGIWSTSCLTIYKRSYLFFSNNYLLGTIEAPWEEDNTSVCNLSIIRVVMLSPSLNSTCKACIHILKNNIFTGVTTSKIIAQSPKHSSFSTLRLVLEFPKKDFFVLAFSNDYLAGHLSRYICSIFWLNHPLTTWK